MRFTGRFACIAVWVVNGVLTGPALAQAKFTVLHAFGRGSDGGGAYSGVAFDQKGNLYGTTSGGGVYGYGTVYQLKHRPDQSWAEKVIHSFAHASPDGEEPEASVVFDSSGKLYGTAQLGGIDHGGTVFQMVHGRSGWSFEVIYDFCSQSGCSDGGSPWGNLVMDAAGNLYGTAFNVFELSPGPDGWTETVLHDFCQQPCSDGYQPFAGVIIDAKGNLFGTTVTGGAYGYGTVFKVTHKADGSWSERVLHSFGGAPNDGMKPGVGALVFDRQGSLYGTTAQGGKNGCGTVHCGVLFRLTPTAGGHWKETILHHFKKGLTGSWPGAGVVTDEAGNLYGTTGAGGTDCDCGVVYKLSPNPDGTWTYTVLHSFSGTDGAQPDANLILDDKGNLYGTTVTGGPEGYGVVFEITP